MQYLISITSVVCIFGLAYLSISNKPNTDPIKSAETTQIQEVPISSEIKSETTEPAKTTPKTVVKNKTTQTPTIEKYDESDFKLDAELNDLKNKPAKPIPMTETKPFIVTSPKKIDVPEFNPQITIPPANSCHYVQNGTYSKMVCN